MRSLLNLVFLFLLTSCNSDADKNCIVKQGNADLKIVMHEKEGICTSLTSHVISDKKEIAISKWKLNYPTYHFECADIDGEGTDDILLGVIKATRFDSVKRKRIFIFKLVEGYIRPLWLGSRVSQPLEEFRVIKSNSKNRVRTIEQEKNGNFLVAEYQWKGFGLSFIRYLDRNLDAQTAKTIFNSSTQKNENT